METHCLSKNHQEIDSKENGNENASKKEKGDNIPKQNKAKRTSIKDVNKTQNTDQYKQVTKEDLQNLCDQLSSFNKRIQTAKEIIYLKNDLPVELQEKLGAEAEELKCLYAELQSATNNIETIRNQREALHKEKLDLEGQLSGLKNDAVHELEVIVSVYDGNMMERWTTVKSSNSIPALDNFLQDVKGKLQAMKNLQTLGSQKLFDLQNKENQEENTTKKKKRNREERVETSQTRTQGSSTTQPSQTSINFLLDTDSEDLLEDSAVESALYTLVCEEVLNLPAWTLGPMDID